MGAVKRQTQKRYPFAEFWEMEQQSEIRHDFHMGEVFVLAGASKKHNTIIQNIVLGAGMALRENGCHMYVEGTMVQTQKDRTYL